MNEISKNLAEALKDDNNCELYYHKTRSIKLSALNGAISGFTSSDRSWTSARVVSEQRQGSAFAEKTDVPALKSILSSARESMRFGDPDEGNALYEKAEVGAFDGLQGNIDSMSVAEKKAALLDLESFAKSLDSRIVNLPICWYQQSERQNTLANSFGLEKSQKNAECYAVLEVMAKSGDEVQTMFDYSVAASPDAIDWHGLARRVVDDTLAKFDAREMPSGSYPVVFNSECASELMSAFFGGHGSPFFGENIQKGRSMLSDKLGQKIGSPLFTIVDMPTRGLSPSYFDGDGMATSECRIVEGGVFQTVVHSLYSASREAGASSTGHGSRGKSGVGTALHNPMLTPGEGTVDDLCRAMGSGLLITEADGLHAGLNQVTGDFSLSARGFAIKGGKKDFPVRNIVVSGNFFDLAMSLELKANDAREFSRHSLVSPAIYVGEMSVSGE